MQKIGFSPSLMCMPLLRVEEQIAFLNNKCDAYHVDIMDGHFVPNITLSPTFVKEVNAIATLPLDCHLMVENPINYVDELAKVGASMITVHVESLNGKAYRLFNRLNELGIKKGLAVNPETSVSELTQLLKHIDKVTVMTVDPGFAGQPFISDALDKIEQLAKFRAENDLDFKIEVDGCCNKTTFYSLATAGADVFVLGSGLFNQDEDIAQAWEKFSLDLDSSLKDKITVERA